MPRPTQNRRKTSMRLKPDTLKTLDQLQKGWGCTRTDAVERTVAQHKDAPRQPLEFDRAHAEQAMVIVLYADNFIGCIIRDGASWLWDVTASEDIALPFAAIATISQRVCQLCNATDKGLSDNEAIYRVFDL